MILHVVVEWRIDNLWGWYYLLTDFCRFRKRIGIRAEILSCNSWRGLKIIDGIHFISSGCSGRVVIVFIIVTREIIASCKTTAKIITITAAWDVINISTIAVATGGKISIRVVAVIGVIIRVIAVRLLWLILSLIYGIRWTQWHRWFLSLTVRGGILKSW